MLNTEQTMQFGSLTQRMLAAANKNPLLLTRFEKTLSAECGEVATLSTSEQNADINAQIMAMGNGRGAATASTTVATLTAEWERVKPSLSAALLTHLRNVEGSDSPVRLCMRYRLIEQTKAAGRDPRTVGGL